MATQNAYTRYCCCCYIRNTNTLQGEPTLRVDVPSSLSASVCGWRANQSCAGTDRTCTVSTDGTSWPGRAASLIGRHSASVTRDQTISHTEHTSALIQRHELSFGEAKLFASKLQNLYSKRITPENGLGMVAWAHNCSAAAVYSLKCERLITPGVPWCDSLITCHCDLCKW